MADFNNLRDQAKQWLSSMFIPKEISPEGVANTGIGAMGMGAGALLNPGTVPLMYGLDKLLKTKAGKQIQTMLDATGPMGGGLDDLVVAGAKTAPAALGMVAPLVSNLGRLKPRGVPAKPTEYFHSNLAEAVDKAWLAEGKPSDLLNIKQVKSWLNKLPGMGVKKEEIKHFDLASKLNELEKGTSRNVVDFGDDDLLLGLIDSIGEAPKKANKVTTSGTPKISKQDLADIIDRKMPVLNIDNGTDYGEPEIKYSDYTLPNKQNYQNHLIRPDGADINDGYDYLKNPMVDPNHSAGVHWEDPNVLQHIRTTDRILPDGRKSLYAEEVQSDWQQQHPETYPLVQNYEDLAHKYLYRKAADEGYDSVAWTPGSVHIDRWNGSKQPPKPIESILDLDIHGPDNLWKRYTEEANAIEDENPFIVRVDGRGNISPEWRELIKPIQEKYVQLANEQGVQVPAKDERFSGFESFYNKRMVDSATGMLKRMGGGKVSETPLNQYPILNKYTGELDDYIPPEPVDLVLKKYSKKFGPEDGYIQPSPTKSMVYNIRPEDKAAPASEYKYDLSRQKLGHPLVNEVEDFRNQLEEDPSISNEDYESLMRNKFKEAQDKLDWQRPMAGKTVPLWMLLSGFAFDKLRGDQK